jgi:hypothetical protein
MAFTDDHAVARLNLNEQKVGTILARELQPGDLIIVREGGEKDILREVAEQLIGVETYGHLRRAAGFWRGQIRASEYKPEQLRKLLQEEGLDRGLPTLRYWMSEEGPIGPHDPEVSLPIIAAALGESPDSREWAACLSAIHNLRRLHVTTGFKLTQVLLHECGEAIQEHSEHETPFELSLGTVWLLEVEQVEAERRPWPYTQVNRIQWESDSWRRRLLRRVSGRPLHDAADILKALVPELSVEEDA